MIIFAPFSDSQVESLNIFQKTAVWHPFTCGENHAEDNILIATAAGWICPNCDYTQDWCHDFMCNGSWEHRSLKNNELLEPSSDSPEAG